MTLQVHTRRGGVITGPVPEFERLTFAEQQNTPTGGTIVLPAWSPALAHLLTASTDPEVVGLVVTDPITGRVTPLHVVEEKFTGLGDKVTVKLAVDTALLNEIPAFPDPATPATPWAVNSHWTATGTAVTTTALFLATHGGPSSHADYQRFALVAETGAGGTVAYRARMQPSLDVIRETVAGQATVEATITDTKAMALEVRAPIDRPNVVFSAELHTMTDWEYANRMPPANVFYGGGEGEGTLREIATAELPPGLWSRKRGVFLDRSSTGADLQGEVDKEATWPGPSLTINAVDRGGLMYGRDWLIGDTVRADIGSTRLTLPVAAVTTTVTSASTSRAVTLGTPNLAARPDLDLKRALFSRFGLTEHS